VIKSQVYLAFYTRSTDISKEIKMAQQTECQTPGTIYNISISESPDRTVICTDVILPKLLALSEEQAKLLEANIHNALELVLSRYFQTENISVRMNE
jgi:hypothetical protein